MTGTTTGQTALPTATDSDDNDNYLTVSLVAALQALANLFESGTGHDHSGSGKGKPIASAGIASGVTLTGPHFTSPVVDSGGITVTAGDVTQADGSGQKIAGQPPAARLHAIGAVASSGLAQLLDTASRIAYVVILCVEEGSVAVFITQGGANTVAEVSDPGGIYSPTAGTATSTNVYWSGGNARYEIQNLRGSTRTYYVWYVATT